MTRGLSRVIKTRASVVTISEFEGTAMRNAFCSSEIAGPLIVKRLSSMMGELEEYIDLSKNPWLPDGSELGPL